MRVVFSDRAFTAVLAETTEKIRTETGGLFLGEVEKDTWYIIETIDPGPKSIFEVAYFEYDQEYTQHLINKIANLYDKKLNLIGLWHRHPGSFDVFSGTDDGTNTKYASMREEGAISALVNIDPSFRLTVYHVSQPCRYEKITYEVGNDLIPDEYLKLKTPQRYKSMMTNMLYPSDCDVNLEPSVSFSSFMRLLQPRLKERRYDKKINKPTGSVEGVRSKIIDSLLSDIMFMSDEIGIKMSVVQKNYNVALVQDTVDGMTKVFFAYLEDDDTVIFRFDGENYLYEEGMFETFYQIAKEEINSDIRTDRIGSQERLEHDNRRIINGIFHLIKSNRSDN